MGKGVTEEQVMQVLDYKWFCTNTIRKLVKQKFGIGSHAFTIERKLQNLVNKGKVDMEARSYGLDRNSYYYRKKDFAEEIMRENKGW